MVLGNKYRTRVKICGITRPEDGVAAARLGADAIGLNFYQPSPRVVDLQQASEIAAAVPPFVAVVGVFVNAATEFVRQVLDRVPIDVLQFHGDEQPADCAQFGHPFIKVLAVRDGVDIRAQVRRFGAARALLLDTWQKDLRGGSGKVFNWALIPHGLARPIVLAGGLTPENVAAAIERVQPYAVDVSGGVESAKGIKDATKIAAFIEGVNSVGTIHHDGG